MSPAQDAKSSSAIGPPGAFLLAGLAAFFTVAAIGWREPILDLASFRQTQTALSADYLLRDGFSLAYATPVLGAPWSLPFEFPVYQALVAACVRLTGLPLDQAGRAVSLLFALGALALLFVFVLRATSSRAAACFAAGLAGFTPVFLFYSRTFLIESTALCFALGLLVALQDFLLRPRLAAAGWIFAAGLLAALTKATTYAVALAALAVLLVAALPTLLGRLRSTGKTFPLAAAASAALALPFLAGLAWVRWTDLVKQRNDLAAFTTSAALHDWNYGTWQQRLNPATWTHLAATTDAVITGTGWLGTVALAAVLTFALFRAAPALRRFLAVVSLAALAAFCAGPLVFTNLYWVHDYYFYAIALYVPLLVGASLGVAWDHSRLAARAVLMLVALFFAVSGVRAYRAVYLPQQRQPDRSILPLAEKIRELVPPDTVLLIEGSEWDSALPYYAQHRALTNREALSAVEPRLHNAVARLDHPLGAVVARNWARTDWEFLARQARGLDASLVPAYRSDAGDVYLVRPSGEPPPSDSLWARAGFSVQPRFFGGPAIELTSAAGQPAVFAHAPSLILLPRAASQRTLSLRLGLREDAYANTPGTDGVTFSVDFFPATGGPSVRLVERRLDPARVPADRGLQSLSLSLPGATAGTVVLRTETGPTATCDWSVWREVHLN